jgi:hypothetical protein
MGQTTTRYKLYLAGGGSSGTITPDEPVDIDKLNDNFRRLDAALGLTVTPDAALPTVNVGVGQIFKASTSDALVYWDGANYQDVLPARLKNGTLTSTYYTKTQFGGDVGQGALDGRYFTETELLNSGVLDSVYPAKGTVKSVQRGMLPYQDFFTTATVSATTADSDSGHPGFSGTVDVVWPDGRFNTAPVVNVDVQRASSFESHWGIKAVSATQATLYYWSSNSVSNITLHVRAGAVNS